MAYYETVFITRPDVSVTAVKDLAAFFQQIIEAQQGQIHKIEYSGLKTFAYRMKKNRKGHYTLLNIESSPAALKEMERKMSLNEDVLRFLTVCVPTLNPNPSALATTRPFRDRPEDESRSRPPRTGEVALQKSPSPSSNEGVL